MWYRYRRGPRLRHLWFLVIPLFFFAGHGGAFGILLWIASIIVISLIVRAVFAMMSGSNTWSTTRNQWYQPRNQQSYYQPTQQQQPYYQPTPQPPHQSYQQGYQQPYYQPHTDAKQQASEQQQYQQPYDQYEQPRAEYQQELPPMEQ